MLPTSLDAFLANMDSTRHTKEVEGLPRSTVSSINRSDCSDYKTNDCQLFSERNYQSVAYGSAGHFWSM